MSNIGIFAPFSLFMLSAMANEAIEAANSNNAIIGFLLFDIILL